MSLPRAQGEPERMVLLSPPHLHGAACSSHPVASRMPVEKHGSQDESSPAALWTDLLGGGSVLALRWLQRKASPWESWCRRIPAVGWCRRVLRCGGTEHPLPRLPP